MRFGSDIAEGLIGRDPVRAQTLRYVVPLVSACHWPRHCPAVRVFFTTELLERIFIHAATIHDARLFDSSFHHLFALNAVHPFAGNVIKGSIALQRLMFLAPDWLRRPFLNPMWSHVRHTISRTLHLGLCYRPPYNFHGDQIHDIAPAQGTPLLLEIFLGGTKSQYKKAGSAYRHQTWHQMLIDSTAPTAGTLGVSFNPQQCPSTTKAVHQAGGITMGRLLRACLKLRAAHRSCKRIGCRWAPHHPGPRDTGVLYFRYQAGV